MNPIKNKMSQVEYKIRDTSLMRDMVYPWNNYDFDLNTYISNNYTPKKLGISNKPTLDTFVKDMTDLPKYPNYLAVDPLLKSNTRAGYNDISPNNKNLLNLKRKYQDFKEPYPGFSKEYPEYFPLEGERSSSYFIKIGTCPVKSKTKKKECVDGGFQWVSNIPSLPISTQQFFPQKATPLNPPGKCYKPRYMFIDNRDKPILGMKGPIVNITNDVLNLNPMSLIGIFTNGESLNREMRPLPCIEGFTSNINHSPHLDLLMIIILFSIICIYIIYIIFYR